MRYDYIIVGSGFYGSICANELNKVGKKVLVLENRNHIGGNSYTEKRNDINIHIYGPHIFHTSNQRVWEWINQFVSFNNFILSPVANYKGKLYSLPFNMWTFQQLWGVTQPSQAKKIIEDQGSIITGEPRNLEEQAIKFVGVDVYEKLIKGYTTKQWFKDPFLLPKEIIKRLPVRFVYDNNYFNDRYQGIPIGGYTQIFEKLLKGIEVRLNTDYFKTDLPEHGKVIFTGPIDKFFNYKFGKLEYKTVRFDHKHLETSNYQGCAVMNFTEKDVEFTRIIEHKHFDKSDTPTTWITHEYPTKYIADETEPYYPVNDDYNNQMYKQYKELSDTIKDKVVFGGRLGEYKYYDMHQVIESAINFIKKEIDYGY